MKLLAGVLVVSLAAVAIPTMANHPPGFGMPDQAIFGLCTAYMANEKGRENGNAGNAPPFHWLVEQAEEEFGDEEDPVAAYCEEYGQHPGKGNGPGGNGPPGGQGPP